MEGNRCKAITFDCVQNKSTANGLFAIAFRHKNVTFDWINANKTMRVRGWFSANKSARLRRTSLNCLLARSVFSYNCSNSGFVTVIIKYCSVEQFLPFLSFIRNECDIFSVHSLLNVPEHARPTTSHSIHTSCKLLQIVYNRIEKKKCIYDPSQYVHCAMYIGPCTACDVLFTGPKWFIFTDNMLLKSECASEYNDTILFLFPIVVDNFFPPWKMMKAHADSCSVTILLASEFIFGTRRYKRRMDYGAIVIRLEIKSKRKGKKRR